MGVMNQLKHLLSKPFPQEESFAQTLKIITGISVFVVVFLYVFKPFGMHTLESGQFLMCLSYGVVAFVTSVFYEFIVVYLLKVKGEGANFSYGRWIVYFIGAMLFISLANFLFVRIVLFDSIEWNLFPYMIRGTFAVGFFPIVVIGTVALLKQEKKYQDIAAEYNQKKPARVDVIQSDEVLLFGIPSSGMRYVQAMQNYVKIGYLDGDGQFEERIERATLKSVLDQAPGNSILRCHRSFLVNRDAIISISGNAQGLMLTLSGCQQQIPVSRSYVPKFRAQNAA